MDMLKLSLDAANDEDGIACALQLLLSDILFTESVDRRELIRMAKRKRESDTSIWTLRVRRLFGESLKKHGFAQQIFALRRRMSPPDTEGFGRIYGCGAVNGESLLFKSIPLLHSVSKVSSGGFHVLAMTSDGSVFSMGGNSFGQLGHTIHSEHVGIFSKVFCLPPCRDVSAGYAFSFAITASGDTYGWGASDNGRLGIPTDHEYHPSPELLRSSEPFCNLSAGSMHCVAIGEHSGTLYAWGCTAYNGTNSSNDVWSPTTVESLLMHRFFMTSIGPGGYHTLALTVDGELFGWGQNRVGQLTGETMESFFVYRPLSIRTSVAFACAGWGHSLVVDYDGSVHVVGRNYRGQLGVNPSTCPENDRGHPYRNYFTKIRVPDRFKVHRATCGGEFCAIIGTLNGKKTILTWGCDPEKDSPEPEEREWEMREIEFEKEPKDIVAGMKALIIVA